MKKAKIILSVLLILAALFGLAACGAADSETTAQNGSNTSAPKSQGTESKAGSQQTNSGGRSLVVYFSRTGEQYRVGVIEEGNTAIVAKLIAEKTGADLYEILPAADNYPTTYSELTDYAKKEQSENARPAIKGDLPDLSGCDTVFIGAPVWWGDWPMICYTFFESADLSGKKLVPFSTHEGSGLSGFDKKLASAVSGAEVLDGLAIRGSDCQNDKTGVGAAVDNWLAELGF